MEEFSYKEVRDDLKTGDVIAFSGKGRASNLIKWKTKSEISHVAIVLDTFVEEFGKSIFMCESTTLVDQKDAITKDLIKGVQIHYLSQRLSSYNGDVYIAPLKLHLNPKKRVAMQMWLRTKHAERTPYDTVQALGAGLDLFDSFGLENSPDFNSLFCSEKVSRALQIGGAVDSRLNPSEQTPDDVIKYDCLSQMYKIKNG